MVSLFFEITQILEKLYGVRKWKYILKSVHLNWHAWRSFISMDNMIISLCNVFAMICITEVCCIRYQECVSNRWENAQQISNSPLMSHGKSKQTENLN